MCKFTVSALNLNSDCQLFSYESFNDCSYYYYSSEKWTNSERYALKMVDFEIKPTYFFSLTTGRFHTPVSLNFFITLSILSSSVIIAGGMVIKSITFILLYFSLSNMNCLTSSSRTTPQKFSSRSITGKILRFDLDMIRTNSPKVLLTLTVSRSVLITVFSLSIVSIALFLLWVISSPLWASRIWQIECGPSRVIVR